VHDIGQHGPELLALAALNLIEANVTRPRFTRVRSHSAETPSPPDAPCPSSPHGAPPHDVGIDWQSTPICCRKRVVTRTFGSANAIRSVRIPQRRHATRRSRVERTRRVGRPHPLHG
jgi:hypothetical protein